MDMRVLLCAGWLCLGTILSAGRERVALNVPRDGSRVEVIATSAGEPKLSVSCLPAKGGPIDVMGRAEVRSDRLVFTPSLPFLPGQRYRADWTDRSGLPQHAEFEIQTSNPTIPTVRLLPQSPLPANALKLYLHFSQPMEQGVFLERLRLVDASGHEVSGPFRETELWSPDGMRLTVWFHPGRQKTGVNLNADEGPVLHENMRYTLIVGGAWRSTAGAALGKDVSFDIQAGPADHNSPGIDRWEIIAPKAGTRDPLAVRFDEPLDTAMLKTALTVHRAAGDAVLLEIDVAPDGRSWQARPVEPWQQGRHELRAVPDLEDLAGNSLARLFEVDVTQAEGSRPVKVARRFEVP